MSNQTNPAQDGWQIPTTICTCIEAGGLEQQVVLLAETLRQFGGKWAATPFYAVKPRPGPALARETVRRLKALDVVVVDESLSGAFSWWDMVNKPASLRYVEEHATTPYVTWMDGDMMILREPQDYQPAPGFDYKGRAAEAFDIASNGSDERADYWRRLCDVFGLDFDAFPTITSFPDAKPIKAYWQGGLFTYARDSRFGAHFYDIYCKLLSTPIAPKIGGTYHADQVSLALTVQAMKLKADQYDPRMNFNFSHLAKQYSKLVPMDEVRVLHYHGSFWPEVYDSWARPELAVELDADHLALMDRYLPLNGGSKLVRLERKVFKALRSSRLKAYEKSVVLY